jgi:hypothetical protein
VPIIVATTMAVADLRLIYRAKLFGASFMIVFSVIGCV